jgi:elongation factor Ts
MTANPAAMSKKVSVEAIKALRDKTSASLNDVRTALEQSGGDESKALAFLRERGAAIAEKRQGRTTGQGRVEAYVHHDGRLGAVVEVNCETDFVARTPEFQQFCKDLALHVAAMNPRFVKADEAPASEKLIESEILLTQPFVKDPGTSIQDLVKALIAKTGENVVIRRFSRFEVGGAA